MNSIARNFTFLLVLGCAGALAAPLAVAQEPAQQGARPVALESLRAGAVSDAGLVLASTDREVLAAASAPILETLRATNMDFSDHETEIILVTALVVVLIVVLL